MASSRSGLRCTAHKVSHVMLLGDVVLGDVYRQMIAGVYSCKRRQGYDTGSAAHSDAAGSTPP